MAISSPLSFGQLSLWRNIENSSESQRGEVNLVHVWKVPAGPSTEDVVIALHSLSLRHEALRTTLEVQYGTEPRQIIAPSAVADFEVLRVAAGEEHLAVEATVARLDFHPFNILSDAPWKAVVIVSQGRPTDVVVTVHHIAADFWALGLLGADFRKLLKGPITETAPTPRDLAAEQRGPSWDKKRRAVRSYFHKIYSAADGGGGLPSSGVPVKASLHSGVALQGARELAAHLGITVPSVILAALGKAAADAIGVRTYLLNTMCANRFQSRDKNLVVSMNQWVPIICQAGQGRSFEESAQEIHRATLMAYRHGRYNPDERAEIREQLFPGGTPQPAEFHFNFTPNSSAGIAPDPTNMVRVVRERPSRTIGPRFMVAASEFGDLLVTARTMLDGFSEDHLVEYLTSVNNILSRYTV
ncbi:condensation domain-containing protein [Streptomyces natalensis]|uniref:condensation domain-containing protein n=1 Tax=Streptomyces natalensis TaxID=68242 RepID=UPI00099DFBC2|nr:condensation domain-containing protein [Streptomyces natalensis]